MPANEYGAMASTAQMPEAPNSPRLDPVLTKKYEEMATMMQALQSPPPSDAKNYAYHVSELAKYFKVPYEDMDKFLSQHQVGLSADQLRAQQYMDYGPNVDPVEAQKGKGATPATASFLDGQKFAAQLQNHPAFASARQSYTMLPEDKTRSGYTDTNKGMKTIVDKPVRPQGDPGTFRKSKSDEPEDD